MIYNFIQTQYRFIYKTFLMFFFFAIAYLFFKENRGKKSKEKMLSLLKQPRVILFLLYASYLLTATVVGRYYKRPYGLTFSHFGIRIGDPAWNEDIINNIILFIPLTLSYNFAFRPKKIFKTDFYLSFFTTVFIELSQLIGWLGSFQFADMFHNVIGGMLGCGVWCLAERIISEMVKTSYKP